MAGRADANDLRSKTVSAPMDARRTITIERRRRQDRRGEQRRQLAPVVGVRCPTWPEQRVQFLTRYLFWCLALLFFNLTRDGAPVWLSITWINLTLLVYGLCNTLFFLHARKHPSSPTRYRLAMWTDIAIVSFAVLNDPHSLPPSMLVFIVVVLGNGMRYGMRIFAEVLAGCLGALMITFSLRFLGDIRDLSPGFLFLNLFGAIILVYSRILMGRVEDAHRQLEEQSMLDSLTGIMNRRALFKFAEHLVGNARRHGIPVVIMFMDLDRFKEVNDSHGHRVGDRVLRDVASTLRKSLRAADIVGRFGGDEFVALLSDVDLDQAEQAARRIQAKVDDYARRRGYNISITIALGEVPRHGLNLGELLDRVDSALYRAKARPGGSIERVGDEVFAPAAVS